MVIRSIQVVPAERSESVEAQPALQADSPAARRGGWVLQVCVAAGLPLKLALGSYSMTRYNCCYFQLEVDHEFQH